MLTTVYLTIAVEVETDNVKQFIEDFEYSVTSPVPEHKIVDTHCSVDDTDPLDDEDDEADDA